MGEELQMSDEKTPVDWASDVKRYAPDADDGVIAKIVSYCGIALRTRDASLVSFSDKAETDRVRERFCRKKLLLDDTDEVIDAAIASVGERMSDARTRNRVTVYYLLAEHFGKLGLFAPKPAGASKGSKAAASAATVVPIAPLAAAGVAAAPGPEAMAEPAEAEPEAVAAPVAPEPAAAAPIMAAAPPTAAAPLAAASLPTGGHAARPGSGGSDGNFAGFAMLVFGIAAVVMIVAAIAGSYVGGRFDRDPPPPPAAPVAVAEPAAPVIPEGAGVISEVVEGRPKVSVYFAVGNADIAPDFTAAVAPIKAWLDANPDDRVQLSGFSDPTGNAEANAELAKNRAQAVAAALAEQGIAGERMDLVKPEDTTDEAAVLSAARRVEITVTPG
jgi:outer membrane protein OmpA-like peptidoglycan-associated protein